MTYDLELYLWRAINVMGVQHEHEKSPRVVIARMMARGLIRSEKQAWRTLEKWSARGWYDYGVNLELGWRTIPGGFPRAVPGQKQVRDDLDLAQSGDAMKPTTDPMLYIFDADNTLRRCTVDGQPCPNRPGEWELLPDVQTRLAEIDWTTRFFGIASNQGGIALGHLDATTSMRMLAEMAYEAIGRWLPEGAIQVCPHAPDAGCRCRKPRPALLQQVMAVWGVGPAETLYIGDQESDRLAAENAGVAFVWAKDFFAPAGGGPARGLGIDLVSPRAAP